MQPKQPCSFSHAGFAGVTRSENLCTLIRFSLRLAASFAGSSAQDIKPCRWWFCEVRRTKAIGGIEGEKSRTKWISDYRAFPNCDVERSHEYLASLRYIVGCGNSDIIAIEKADHRLRTAGLTR